jgi:hypothetical protein
MASCWANQRVAFHPTQDDLPVPIKPCADVRRHCPQSCEARDSNGIGDLYAEYLGSRGWRASEWLLGIKAQ